MFDFYHFFTLGSFSFSILIILFILIMGIFPIPTFKKHKDIDNNEAVSEDDHITNISSSNTNTQFYFSQKNKKEINKEDYL